MSKPVDLSEAEAVEPGPTPVYADSTALIVDVETPGREKLASMIQVDPNVVQGNSRQTFTRDGVTAHTRCRTCAPAHKLRRAWRTGPNWFIIGRLMRQLISLVLALIMCHQLLGEPEPHSNIATELKAVPIGSKVEVKMKDGDSIRGRLLSVDADSFTVAVSRPGGTAREKIPFSDAEIVKRNTHTPAIAWIATGAIIGIVVIVVSVILIERHNEGA